MANHIQFDVKQQAFGAIVCSALQIVNAVPVKLLLCTEIIDFNPI